MHSTAQRASSVATALYHAPNSHRHHAAAAKSTKKAVLSHPSKASSKRGSAPMRAGTNNIPRGNTQLKSRACPLRDSIDGTSRAEAVATGRGGETLIDFATECKRLRDELERLVPDHQRQTDEIVALRALARSLKEEVETVHSSARPSSPTRASTRELRSASHGFFQLDDQLDALIAENELLKARVLDVERQNRKLESVVKDEIPRHKMLAVQARAELESLASQLSDEQEESDRVRRELAYYQARSCSPGQDRWRRQVLQPDEQSAIQVDKENRYVQNTRIEAVCGGSPRESLISSQASQCPSSVSSKIESDVENLKVELRLLHQSIDASELLAKSNISPRHRSSPGRGADRKKQIM